MVEAGGLDDGEDGTEDLFERDAGAGGDVGEDGGGDVEAAIVGDGVAAEEEAGFGVAQLDVVKHALAGDGADDGAGVEVFGGVAEFDGFDFFLEAV